MITLVTGKFYKTREGKSAFVVGECPFWKETKDSFICSVEGNIHRYFPNGNWMSNEYEDGEYYLNDIVQEDGE